MIPPHEPVPGLGQGPSSALNLSKTVPVLSDYTRHLALSYAAGTSASVHVCGSGGVCVVSSERLHTLKGQDTGLYSFPKLCSWVYHSH